MGKICYLGDSTSNYVQNWLNYFAGHGWKVDIITRNPADRKLLHPDVTQHALHIHRAKYGFPVHLYMIHKIINQIKPDIVHAHGTASYGIYAIAVQKYPFVLSEWGPSHIETSKGVHRKLEERAYRKAELISTEVEETKLILADEYNINKNKIKTLLWGVDLSQFNRNYLEEATSIRKKLGIAPDDFVLIYARGLSQFYGIEHVLYVLKELIGEFPAVKLIFFRNYCPNDYYHKIIDLIKKLKLQENIIPEEHVDNAQIPIYYNAADMSINLLEQDNGSPVIAEAMACGCIVLGTACRGYKTRIINGKNGFLIGNREDIERIADIIRLCILNCEIKEKFYRYNKKYVETYENWNIQMKKMEGMYYQVIENCRERKVIK